MAIKGKRVLKSFSEKRVYFNPEKNQECFVYYMGGQHGPLKVSKLVCERYLDWEVGEWSEQANLSEIPSSWERVGTVARDTYFLGYINGKSRREKSE